MSKMLRSMWVVCIKCSGRFKEGDALIHQGVWLCLKCQPNIFSNIKESNEEINKITDESIKKSFDHANSEWRGMALDSLEQICLTHVTFTVNDVRDLVKWSHLKTHDNRAMGGVIKRGVANKWMEATGKTIPSLVGHKVHIQIWKSLIIKKKENE